MRYKLEDILTFLTVIEAGGLTAAARRLGVAKSVALHDQILAVLLRNGQAQFRLQSLSSCAPTK